MRQSIDSCVVPVGLVAAAWAAPAVAAASDIAVETVVELAARTSFVALASVAFVCEGSFFKCKW